jgi:nucleotide-binding universal stress UspA family protein
MYLPRAHVSPAGRSRPVRGIVVALDLSQDAEAILEPVIALAGMTGAGLTLVHVAELIFEIGRPAMPGPILADTELLEASRIEAQDRLERIAARLRKPGLKVAAKPVLVLRPQQAVS